MRKRNRILGVEDYRDLRIGVLEIRKAWGWKYRKGNAQPASFSTSSPPPTHTYVGSYLWPHPSSLACLPSCHLVTESLRWSVTPRSKSPQSYIMCRATWLIRGRGLDVGEAQEQTQSSNGRDGLRGLDARLEPPRRGLGVPSPGARDPGNGPAVGAERTCLVPPLRLPASFLSASCAAWTPARSNALPPSPPSLSPRLARFLWPSRSLRPGAMAAVYRPGLR